MTATVPLSPAQGQTPAAGSASLRWQDRAAAMMECSPAHAKAMRHQLAAWVLVYRRTMPADLFVRLGEEITEALRGEAVPVSRELLADAGIEDAQEDEALARFTYDPSPGNRDRLLRELEDELAVKRTLYRALRAHREGV